MRKEELAEIRDNPSLTDDQKGDVLGRTASRFYRLG